MSNGFRNMQCLLTHGKCKEGWCGTPGVKGSAIEGLALEVLLTLSCTKKFGTYTFLHLTEYPWSLKQEEPERYIPTPRLPFYIKNCYICIRLIL